MAGLAPQATLCIFLEPARLLVDLEHLVGVAVISRDDDRAVHRLDDRNDPGEREIDRLDGDHGRVEASGVPDHIAVGVVDAGVPQPVSPQGGDGHIGDFGRLHPRALLEWDDVTRNLDILLVDLVEHAGAVAVPEVGHVAVLLGFAARELADLIAGEILAHRSVDRRRLHEKVSWQLEIAVVFHHAHELHRRNGSAIELA